MGKPLTPLLILGLPVGAVLVLAVVVTVTGVHQAPAALECAHQLFTSLLVAIEVVGERLLDGDVRGAVEALRAV